MTSSLTPNSSNAYANEQSYRKALYELTEIKPVLSPTEKSKTELKIKQLLQQGMANNWLHNRDRKLVLNLAQTCGLLPKQTKFNKHQKIKELVDVILKQTKPVAISSPKRGIAKSLLAITLLTMMGSASAQGTVRTTNPALTLSGPTNALSNQAQYPNLSLAGLPAEFMVGNKTDSEVQSFIELFTVNNLTHTEDKSTENIHAKDVLNRLKTLHKTNPAKALAIGKLSLQYQTATAKLVSQEYYEMCQDKPNQKEALAKACLDYDTPQARQIAVEHFQALAKIDSNQARDYAKEAFTHLSLAAEDVIFHEFKQNAESFGFLLMGWVPLDLYAESTKISPKRFADRLRKEDPKLAQIFVNLAVHPLNFGKKAYAAAREFLSDYLQMDPSGKKAQDYVILAIRKKFIHADELALEYLNKAFTSSPEKVAEMMEVVLEFCSSNPTVIKEYMQKLLQSDSVAATNFAKKIVGSKKELSFENSGLEDYLNYIEANDSQKAVALVNYALNYETPNAGLVTYFDFKKLYQRNGTEAASLAEASLSGNSVHDTARASTYFELLAVDSPDKALAFAKESLKHFTPAAKSVKELPFYSRYLDIGNRFLPSYIAHFFSREGFTSIDRSIFGLLGLAGGLFLLPLGLKRLFKPV